MPPMPPVPAPDPRWPDPAAAATRLGVSESAVRLTLDAELIDLHIDTFIPPRLWGYDVLARHRRAIGGRFFFGHLDLHRIYDGGLSAAMWSITTNPFRPARNRWATFEKNLARFRRMVALSGGTLAFARDRAEYDAVRARGAHAVLLSIQGANALQAAPNGAASLPEGLVTRVTLVHLTSSVYGATSTPQSRLRRHRGLTPAGVDMVRQLDAQRIFLDLAHIHPDAFWDAIEVHDPALPLLATHTGVDGARQHWRNLDDEQLEAIAGTGGTVGVIFSEAFLKRPGGPQDSGMIVDHMGHIIDVVGEDHVSVGSDYDGAIVPPPDLGGGEYPRLVQKMMDRGWDEGRIRKILGDNFLRAFAVLRPGDRVAAAAEDATPPAH
jgi:membrane dipeptidase